jgi:hypothetical protein
VQVTALAPAAITPTGVIAIMDGTKTLAKLTLAGGQLLWITPMSLATGLHVLTATYQGDGNDLTSVSAPFTLTVT